jgi:peroxiredoxin Q/BCP
MKDEFWVGDIVPDFTAQCVKCGNFVLSSKVRESPVLLYFYPANYGLMCTYYSEQMNDHYEDFERIGVKVFHVNPDTVESHAGYMRRVSSRYDHMSDLGREVSWIFGMLVGPPENWDDSSLANRGFVLIDKDMTIRYIWRASIPANIVDLDTLVAEIDRILNGAGTGT